MKIGVCTGGGDCPGLNAAIRAIAQHGNESYGFQVYGIFDSYNGLESRPIRAIELSKDHVHDILDRGGTILGTYNRGGLFTDPGGHERAKRVIGGIKSLNLDALIVIGGEGTQTMAQYLVDQGVPVIGVPKTIDNDLPETDQTIGFASCVSLVADSLNRLRSTAESHDRVMILEVMGRDSGFIALHGGIAGGADIILLPEVPFSYDEVIDKLQRRKQQGRKYSLVVVSEGAYEKSSEPHYKSNVGGKMNLGGIGQMVAHKVYEATGMETRVTVLGHLQRGGSPVAEDKLLATRFGIHAVDLVAQKKFGQVVVLQEGKITQVPYSMIEKFARRKIGPNDSYLLAAEGVGISLGRARRSIHSHQQ
ncbi:MAG: ATP-dependent 6-phosphofructokinase [Zetaproteobacteria bacterium]|nr:ATP-dependent 6-phosphofructokinase [Zetaproteobacteria bacterium]